MKAFPGLTVSGSSPDLCRSVRHLIHVLFTLERVPRDARLSVTFVSLAQMHKLNQVHRGIDGPTDVLTFTPSGRVDVFVNSILFGGDQAQPLHRLVQSSSSAAAPTSLPSSHVLRTRIRAELVNLGDVIVSLDYMKWCVCAHPAANLPLVQYLQAALVHATLHALGEDHYTPELLRQMARREQRLCRQMSTLAHLRPRYLPPLNVSSASTLL